MVKLRHHLFVRALEDLRITPLTEKRVKNPKKSAIKAHILLEGHNATYDDFRFSFPSLISLNYTLRRHYLLKEINQSSIETFTPIPYSFLISA